MHQISNPFDQLDRRLSAIEELLLRALHPNAPAFQKEQDNSLLPIAEFRKKMGICRSTEIKWQKSGKLRPIYIGKNKFVNMKEFVEEQTSRPLTFTRPAKRNKKSAA